MKTPVKQISDFDVTSDENMGLIKGMKCQVLKHQPHHNSGGNLGPSAKKDIKKDISKSNIKV